MKHNCQSGFTLIEMLIYVAIFAFILAVIVPSFVLVESRAGQFSHTQSLVVDQDFVGWYIRSIVEHGDEVIVPSRGACAGELGVRGAGGVVSITTNASSTLVMRGGWGHDLALQENTWKAESFSVCRNKEPFGESITYSFSGVASSTVLTFKTI